MSRTAKVIGAALLFTALSSGVAYAGVGGGQGGSGANSGGTGGHVVCATGGNGGSNGHSGTNGNYNPPPCQPLLTPTSTPTIVVGTPSSGATTSAASTSPSSPGSTPAPVSPVVSSPVTTPGAVTPPPATPTSPAAGNTPGKAVGPGDSVGIPLPLVTSSVGSALALTGSDTETLLWLAVASIAGGFGLLGGIHLHRRTHKEH